MGRASADASKAPKMHGLSYFVIVYVDSIHRMGGPTVSLSVFLYDYEQHLFLWSALSKNTNLLMVPMLQDLGPGPSGASKVGHWWLACAVLSAVMWHEMRAGTC